MLPDQPKSDFGKVSKAILDRINTSIRASTGVNQWRNSSSVTEWFDKISDKSSHTFISFDIVDFYPSISEKLLDRAISWGQQLTTITQHYTIIQHARKSSLFYRKKPWIRRGSENMFDVTMGSSDGAEVCELVDLFILDSLLKKFGKTNTDFLETTD